jgi:hypothetical protein
VGTKDARTKLFVADSAVEPEVGDPVRCGVGDDFQRGVIKEVDTPTAGKVKVLFEDGNHGTCDYPGNGFELLVPKKRLSKVVAQKKKADTPLNLFTPKETITTDELMAMVLISVDFEFTSSDRECGAFCEIGAQLITMENTGTVKKPAWKAGDSHCGWSIVPSSGSGKGLTILSVFVGMLPLGQI